MFDKTPMKEDATERDEVSAHCHKCGHKHVFGSIEELDSTPASTPCEKCGYLFLHHIRSKIDAMMTLLQSDPQAVSLLQAGDTEKLNEYIKEKTGIS
jgi:DNA-directed RNA polymerase subunit RPC12/RpoP